MPTATDPSAKIPIRLLLSTQRPSRLSEVLRRYFDVETVTDGARALEQLHRSRYDLFVTDLCLSVLSGAELLRCFERSADRNRTVVVALAEQRSQLESVMQAQLADRGFVAPVEPLKVVKCAALLLAERTDELARSGFLVALEAAAQPLLGQRGFSAGRLAGEMAMSPRTLQLHMKQHGLPTPAAWLRAQRLEHARALIRGGAISSVTEAAAAAGMSTAHFSRSYAAHFQLPPSHELQSSRRRSDA